MPREALHTCPPPPPPPPRFRKPCYAYCFCLSVCLSVFLSCIHSFIISFCRYVLLSFCRSFCLSFFSFVRSFSCFLSFFQGDPFGDVPTVITRPKFPESVQESLKGTNSGMVCQPSCLLMPHYAVAIAIVFLPLRFIVIHCFFSVRYQEHGSRGFVFGQSQSRRCRTEIA